MSGAIGLQGGAEFSAACRDADIEILSTAPIGPVVILAAAAAPGEEYERAAQNGVRWFRRLTDDNVAAVPDPRGDEEAALAVIEQATMIVLPGGSPGRLVDVLRDTAVGRLLVQRWDDGATISGASAGAMVLGTRVWVPDRGGVEDGLGLFPGVAIPHHGGGAIRRVDGDAGLLRWGLPECGGVIVAGGEVRSIGVAGAAAARDDAHQALSASPLKVDDLLR